MSRAGPAGYRGRVTPADLLIDALGRVVAGVDGLLDGLTDEELAHRPGPDANPVGWLVWHLTRVYDDHVATVAGIEQVYVEAGYAERFALPFDVAGIGYGHTSEEVGQVRVPGPALAEYLHVVHERATAWLSGLTADDFDRVVDDRWDPPVTLAVRLVSMTNDCAQHVGQASYVRGLLGH